MAEAALSNKTCEVHSEAAASPNKILPSTSTRLSDKDREKEKNLPQLVEQLRQRIKDLQPLPDEPEYFVSDESLVRFIRAREYNLKDAEKQLRYTAEWRRKYRPLNAQCRDCRKKPGLHSIRQVGFDLEGRPVIYTCFEQSSSLKHSVESTVEHIVSLCENSVASFSPGCPKSWTWVIDCQGITLSCCNPTLAQEILGLLGMCYPEFLHRVILTNHNTLFHNFWKIIRVFIDPRSIEKVKFVRKRDKLIQCFESMFTREMTDWLLEELRLNAANSISGTQKHFYLPPPPGVAHDPRGTPTYVHQYLEPFADKYAAEQQLLQAGEVVSKRVHQPHPNISDNLLGTKAESVTELEAKATPAISPALDFIRDVIPFGKDKGAVVNGTAGSASKNGSPYVGQRSDVHEKQKANGNGNTNGNGNGKLDGEISDTDDEAPHAVSDVVQKKPEATKDVTDSVMESITSATNKISSFFRELA